MMMSPEEYVYSHRDDSIEELIKERNSLIENLKELEKIVFDPDKKSTEWLTIPGPDVQYSFCCCFIVEICKLIRDKYNNEYDEEEPEDEYEEEQFYLKDFAIFKSMKKRLLKAFDLYNKNCDDTKFKDFQEQFLSALDTFSNGETVDSYVIDISYNSDSGISSVSINLTGNELTISSGGYSYGACGGDSYTDWIISFFSEGEVDNSYEIDGEAFDVFSEILGSDGVDVDFFN